MSGNFSGVVRITDLNDFITPAQACIIPLKTKSSDENAGNVNIRKRVFVAAPDEKSNKVAVSLNDCLACTGCVTSAETVLIQEQSAGKMIEAIPKYEISVVTLSPQAVCSIAAKRSMTVSDTARLICSYLKSKGVRYIIDSSFARELTLELSYEEWVEKHKEPTNSPSPLFCSVCPGFVCYAEKTHGKLLVPLMSRVRSPQAVAGALVKDYLARKLEVSPKRIFHTSVMPCFDKKLEASRAEFKLEDDVPEVDCVISTSELSELIEGIELSDWHEDLTPSSTSWLNRVEQGVLSGNDMKEEPSGAYGEYILRRYLESNKAALKVKREKTDNKEIVEVSNEEDSVVFSMAKIYGFRNIQNMVNKLKKRKFPISYVEVMACPSGCSNGGGQMRADTTDGRQELLAAVNEKYKTISDDAGDMKVELSAIRADWLRLNGEYEKLLKTEFHIVDRNVLGQAALRW